MEGYTTDEETVERLRQWWKENGPWILGGLALGAAVLFGWRYWTEWRENQLAFASDRYEELVSATQAGDVGRAQAIAAELRDVRVSNPYADLAALALARHAVAGGDADAARAELAAVIERGGDRDTVHIATLRLARLELAAGEMDRAARLVQVTDAGRYAPLYAELRGDVAVARGDRDAAVAAYRDALAGAADGIADGAMIRMKLDDLGAAAPERS